MKNIVIIPVYKEKMVESERVSLVQCCKTLNRHDFFLVCPVGLNIRIYSDIFADLHVNYKIERFDGQYFRSVRDYNLLMLKTDFYSRFGAYGYMLIYQLDSYVFRDELDQWCEKGYDYIGAPWVDRFSFFRAKANLLKPGCNGGFSLRKIPSFIKVLSVDSDYGKVLNDYFRSGKNEDGFFSSYAMKIDPAFKVASPEVALHFAFERSPERLYEMTNSRLPFGCHAWTKYNPRFWKKFIAK